MHLGRYLHGCHMHRAAATAVLRLLWTRKQQSNSDQSLTRLVSVCIYAMAVYNTEEALDVILGEDFDSGDESEIDMVKFYAKVSSRVPFPYLKINNRFY